MPTYIYVHINTCRYSLHAYRSLIFWHNFAILNARKEILAEVKACAEKSEAKHSPINQVSKEKLSSIFLAVMRNQLFISNCIMILVGRLLPIK
jgi:hypothetical protein